MSIPARYIFTEQQQQQITQAISDAELNTSGEVRVHIENSCKGDVLDRAAYLFKQLNMHRTRLRNGVLFYLSVHDHKFAILGDMGINQKVPSTFWDEIKEEMAGLFRDGHLTNGLTIGIRKAGEQLKTHFPYQKDDVNELDDEISFGKT
ncbi:MAG: TPM domain-containing protein [Bacteroidales bacterium]|nr:TPM domain-containing protein [Bacteroidales bacterium]